MTVSPKLDRSIALSLTEGATIRDLLYNGFLDKMNARGFGVTIFTEAARVPAFVRDWAGAGVDILPYAPVQESTKRGRAFWMRRRVVRTGNKALLRAWLRMEQKKLYPTVPAYVDEFRARRPALFLGTNAYLYAESQLINSARALSIPTLSLVRSWDNVHKGIRSRPRTLAVWSETNRAEALELEGYPPEDVVVTGGPQFDAYFAPESIWSRERLAEHFSLDPSRPILLFASFGNYKTGPDETCWMDHLLNGLDSGALTSDRGRPQILCRLHPMSRLEQFMRYTAHADVRLSYVDRYCPTLGWFMNRDDVVVVGNILRHADAVITPGSTFTLEGAIFDRPTIVPLFHTYQPEKARTYFNARTLGKHFGRLERLDLVPIIRSAEEFMPAIQRALREPGWYAEQRARLVSDYIHFTDGRSVERLAELVTRLADNSAAV